MSTRQFALRRSSPLTAIAAALAVGSAVVLAAAPPASAGSPRPIAFGTPTGDANCAVTSAPPTIPAESLVCSAPKGYIVLRSMGSAKSITWNKPFSPLGGQPATTLAAGAHWSWDSISCSISWWTITCSNGQSKFTAGKAPPTPNSVPVLGAGGLPAVGFGKTKPGEVYFGGDPTGMFKHLSWSHWGYATATGSGNGYYDPPHKPTAASVPAHVILSASSLGICHGKLAYRELAVTFVYKGHDETGTRMAVCN
jgi:hypothetical protein